MHPSDDSLTIGATTYGVDYAAAVQRDNITGVQFHPEKSHHYGMDVLRRFAQWAPE
jgi:glutamine amidotransferase